eukprot:SAG11_NODE_2413_length_3392_cov_2.367750_4_plen_73_part_01
MRRRKDSQVNGRPIVQLPPKTITVEEVTLSEEERDFYHHIEQQSARASPAIALIVFWTRPFVAAARCIYDFVI